jgi:transcriptional regulator with XRE-family HTH domain
MPDEHTGGSPEFLASFGSRLREAIARSRKSQGEIAEAAGLDQTAVSRLAAGKQRPYADQAASLARVLGIPLEDLLGGLPPEPPMTPDEAYLLRLIRDSGLSTAEVVKRLMGNASSGTTEDVAPVDPTVRVEIADARTAEGSRKRKRPK